MFRRCQRESLHKRYFQERLSIPSHKQGKGYTMKLKYILFVCSIISFTLLKTNTNTKNRFRVHVDTTINIWYMYHKMGRDF